QRRAPVLEAVELDRLRDLEAGVGELVGLQALDVHLLVAEALVPLQRGHVDGEGRGGGRRALDLDRARDVRRPTHGGVGADAPQLLPDAVAHVRAGEVRERAAGGVDLPRAREVGARGRGLGGRLVGGLGGLVDVDRGRRVVPEEDPPQADARGHDDHDRPEQEPPPQAHARATPSSVAAAATAAATSWTTVLSNTDGTTWSGRRSSDDTERAMASAAATFIPSVTVVALASSAPRKIPGKASTLLIWFGKSLRPVAITAATSWMASGRISGSGLAMANTIGSGAIDSTSAAVMIPGPLTPMNTSVPGMISDSEPVRFSGLVSSARRRLASLRSSRPV